MMSSYNPFFPGGLGTLGGLLTPAVRRKCFISYHHDDENEVTSFINKFDHAHNMFISRGLGSTMIGDIINSNNDEYIMSRIRQLYLSDSTVTIVLIGNCTWARRYVDWEIQSSLRSGEKTTPNGLLGIKLPSFSSGQYPYRLNANLLPAVHALLTPDNCYARVIDYPATSERLINAIEDAYSARTSRRKYIVNGRGRYTNDLWCGHFWH
jgi:hypothetical protein